MNLDTFYVPTTTIKELAWVPPLQTLSRGDQVKMSFVHIKDPKKRDEIVADYLASLVGTTKGINQEHTKDLIF